MSGDDSFQPRAWWLNEVEWAEASKIFLLEISVCTVGRILFYHPWSHQKYGFHFSVASTTEQHVMFCRLSLDNKNTAHISLVCPSVYHFLSLMIYMTSRILHWSNQSKCRAAVRCLFMNKNHNHKNRKVKIESQSRLELHGQNAVEVWFFFLLALRTQCGPI